jgi:hypothetical protein
MNWRAVLRAAGSWGLKLETASLQKCSTSGSLQKIAPPVFLPFGSSAGTLIPIALGLHLLHAGAVFCVLPLGLCFRKMREGDVRDLNLVGAQRRLDRRSTTAAPPSLPVP